MQGPAQLVLIEGVETGERADRQGPDVGIVVSQEVTGGRLVALVTSEGRRPPPPGPIVAQASSSCRTNARPASAPPSTAVIAKPMNSQITTSSTRSMIRRHSGAPRRTIVPA